MPAANHSGWSGGAPRALPKMCFFRLFGAQKPLLQISIERLVRRAAGLGEEVVTVHAQLDLQQ